jgi:hypothetical protein
LILAGLCNSVTKSFLIEVCFGGTILMSYSIMLASRNSSITETISLE